MSSERVNGVNLFYERTDSGEPMVLVHGSWGDHHNWSAGAPLLSQSFEVITCDRRGQTPGTLSQGGGPRAAVAGSLKGRTEFQSMLDGLSERIRAVIALLEAGDNAAAAERFVDTLAFGPGAWDNLPPPIRETFIRNAPTFLDETRDPDRLTVDVDSLCRFDRSALLSIGTQRPPFFKPLVQPPRLRCR